MYLFTKNNNHCEATETTIKT